MIGGLTKYRILEKLGSGGMGEVYKAEDLALLRTVAVKVLNKAARRTSGAEMRFLREARAASAINHPNIVTIYEIGETDQHAYIVMEYVEGHSLRNFINTHLLKVDAVIPIALQISDALSEAHARNIIHRDIKPENILLNERGLVKVVDFGIAKSIDAIERKTSAATAMQSLTDTGAVVGTLSYMSPEQLRGEPLDARTDIFSFGIVLYEMITRTLPFAGTTPFDVAASILRDEAAKIARPPAGLPLGISKVVARLLEKEPSNRYQTFMEVKRELDALKDEPVITGDNPDATAELTSLNGTKQIIHRSGTMPPTPIRFNSPPTVLVLPLETVGAGEEGSFIGVGLAQAITTDLARINGISVLSNTARSGRASEAKAGPRDLACELGATIILEGEVMRAGQVIGVMARLTDVATGRVIWGAQYRGDISDLFSIQDAVCESVASALEVSLSNEVRNQMARPATSSLDAFEFYSRGQAFLERRDVKENVDFAIQLFTAALELDNEFALAYAGLGEAYWLKYRSTRESLWVERAIAASDHALSRDPYQAEVHISLGIVYYETGKIDRAIEEFEQAYSLQPASDSAARWLGMCHLRKGDMERAVNYFKRAIELRPGYWENYNRLGVCYYTFGRYQEAAEEFRRVIMIQPDNYIGYSALGGIYTLLGLYEDAIAMHQRAIAIYPNASSYTNLGTCYFYLERFDEAIFAYKAAIELDPRDDIYRRNLGDAYLQVERQDEAKEQFEQACQLIKERLKVNPESAELLGRLAICQAKLRADSDAMARAEQASMLEPRNTTLMYQKAVVYALIGRNDEAVRFLAEALSNGYSRSEAKRDPDLQSLREKPDYIALFAGKA